MILFMATPITASPAAAMTPVFRPSPKAELNVFPACNPSWVPCPIPVTAAIDASIATSLAKDAPPVTKLRPT